MNLQTLFENYLGFIWGAFLFDMNVFSQAWIYIWMCIPAVAYLAFFCIKWFVITLPIFFPFYIIAGAIEDKVENVQRIKKVKQNNEL